MTSFSIRRSLSRAVGAALIVALAACGGGGIKVDPSGKFAFMVNTQGNTVSAYTIDANTGALTAVAGSPFEAGTAPLSVTVDPSGRFAYVANSGSNTVSAYTIHAGTGALTAVAGSPFQAGTTPRSVTVDPSGKFAYVANSGSNDVWVYTIHPTTGALAIAGSPVATGSSPYSIVFTGQ